MSTNVLPTGWAWYVAILTILSLLACLYMLLSNRTRKEQKGSPELHGQNQWDGLAEYDNPLPKWWSNLFLITVIFSVGYLLLYPGLGVFPGLLGWSSEGRHQAEVAAVKAETDPIFNAYLKQDVATVAQDKGALQIGGRLFQTYCVQCHGTDMRGGSKGFPNLIDADWQFSGTPEGIKETLTQGRNGIMPPMGEQLSAEQITDVTQYVLSLSGRASSQASAQKGEATYKQICIACHGPDAKGNQALGAPNLTDDVWLYGGSAATIAEGIAKGRAGVMPSQSGLGEARVHLLAAYVYAQSREAAAGQPKK